MSLQALLTLALLLATVAALASQRLRPDVTALLATLFLVVSGVLEAGEAFSAFGQPVIVIVASIYIIGAALYETGVATILAEQLLRFRKGGSLALLTAVMVTAGLLSAILSSLLVTAILLPAVLRLARKARIAPAQLLLPMTTASSAGNQLTLIAAISNVAINDYLVSSGHASLGLFTLTPFGLASLGTAILWFVLVGRHLLPREAAEAAERPSLGEVEEAYDLEEQLYQVRVRRGSDLIGQRLDESDLRLKFRLNVVAIQPWRGPLQPVRPDWVLEQDDILIVEGDRGDVHQAASLHHLQPKGAIPLDRFETIEEPSMRLAEVMVPYRSNLVGQSVAQSRFRDQHGLNVLAVHREGRPAPGALQEIVLAAGDTLLVQGAVEKLRRVGDDFNLTLVTYLGPQRGELITSKAGLTVAIVASMLAAVVFNVLSLAAAALLAAVTLIVTGCISAERAYRSVDAPVLVLIGGMLPLAMALEKTGLAGLIASAIGGFNLGPLASLALFYALTALLTQVISNTVTGLLLIPIAISLAAGAGLSPTPFAIALMVATGAAYVSPLTHGGNLMIRKAGGYAMRDYLLNNGPIFLLQTAAVLGLLALLYLL